MTKSVCLNLLLAGLTAISLGNTLENKTESKKITAIGGSTLFGIIPVGKTYETQGEFVLNDGGFSRFVFLTPYVDLIRKADSTEYVISVENNGIRNREAVYRADKKTAHEVIPLVRDTTFSFEDSLKVAMWLAKDLIQISNFKDLDKIEKKYVQAFSKEGDSMYVKGKLAHGRLEKRIINENEQDIIIHSEQIPLVHQVTIRFLRDRNGKVALYGRAGYFPWFSAWMRVFYEN